MSQDQITAPPWPTDSAILARWTEQRRRRRLLEGLWMRDLSRRMIETVGSERARAWGEPTLSINPFKTTAQELAVLYDHEPTVSHDRVDVSSLATAISMSGFWSAMQRVQALCIGIREYFVRVDVSDEQRPRYRAVAPDYVITEALVSNPSVPVRVEEYRLRDSIVAEGQKAKKIWTIDVVDISDLDHPVYMVLSGDGKTDLSGHYIDGARAGGEYPREWRMAPKDGELLGRPILPYVLYHAQQLTDRTFDPFEGIELVDGTIDVAVLYQMVLHSFRDASFPQRYIANLEPAGAGIETQDGIPRQEIVADPATILMLQQIGESDTQPIIGQWNAGADVSVLEETLSNLVARLAQDAGIPPSDIQRLGGTARSGAAISLTNEGKRKAQRRYTPSFTVSDKRLVSTTAIMVNRVGEMMQGARKIEPMPEGGYRIAYTRIPLSPEERASLRDDVIDRANAGLITPLKAYMTLNPELSEAKALEDLASMTTRPGTTT